MAAQSIYVHAGMHKTGTSSIQRALAVNRKRLDGSGITVWDIDENHSLPLQFLVRDFRRFKKSRQRERAAAAARRYGTPEMVRERLISALKSSRPKFLISAEGLCLVSEAELRQFLRFIRHQSSRIIVVAYVREPMSLAHTLAQQRLKGGETLDRIVSKVPFFSYRASLEKLFRVFGGESVRIRLYGQTHFSHGDLLTDFFDAIDESPEIAQEFPRSNLNQSMSHNEAMLLNTVNRIARVENRPGQFHWFAKRHLAACLRGPHSG